MKPTNRSSTLLDAAGVCELAEATWVVAGAAALGACGAAAPAS